MHFDLLPGHSATAVASLQPCRYAVCPFSRAKAVANQPQHQQPQFLRDTTVGTFLNLIDFLLHTIDSERYLCGKYEIRSI